MCVWSCEGRWLNMLTSAKKTGRTLSGRKRYINFKYILRREKCIFKYVRLDLVVLVYNSSYSRDHCKRIASSRWAWGNLDSYLKTSPKMAKDMLNAWLAYSTVCCFQPPALQKGKKKYRLKQDFVVHTCNPNSQEVGRRISSSNLATEWDPVSKSQK